RKRSGRDPGDDEPLPLVRPSTGRLRLCRAVHEGAAREPRRLRRGALLSWRALQLSPARRKTLMPKTGRLMGVVTRIPLRLRRPVRQIVIRTVRGRKIVWQAKGVDPELSFWRRWLESKGMHWPDDYRRRLDPNALLDELPLSCYIGQLPDDSVSILDVGAGPLTYLGKR